LLPKSPTILAFDTSAAHCAAALLQGGTITTRIDEMAKGQAEHLMPMLTEVLSDAGLSWSDLDAIGVGTGPGNFTGIRISVSAARGLALGLSIPAIGVNGFEALVHGLPLPIAALIDAPRGSAYLQHFTVDGPQAPEMIVVADHQIDGPLAPTLNAADHVANIARVAAERLGQQQPRPAPLYVRAADAAPPRDPAPVILT
jgi:tRNA threonylcarbamoyl adenosine modification protein YeaZ